MYKNVVESPFLQDLVSIDDQKYVCSLFIERKYPKGHILFYQGDEGNEMYIVKSGSLKICRINEGKEIIFGHQFPGETIGELEALHHNNARLASVITLETSVLWMIKKKELEMLVSKYPGILRKAFYVVSERLAQADRKLEYLAFLDTRIRVANCLLDLASNFGVETKEGVFINWKITQQHFASMIGVGRESAARVLSELQEDLIIKVINRKYYICDMKALLSLSEPHSEQVDDRKWHSIHKYDITSI